VLKRLDTLPRDTRDTLFLLAVIAWVVMPQVSHLPVWCTALAAGVLLWRGWLAIAGRHLPGLGWRLGLLAITMGATLWTHRTLLGRDAGVTLIVVLLALKTLELRARRDAFVIFFLGFFTMLTNFFFSQSLLTAAAMLIALLGLLTALVNAHLVVGRPSLLTALRTAGWMALLGAPIMAVLFVLFPRLAPLWGIPSDAMSGRSGLSATMQVGNIANLALDGSVAMRIKFEERPPPQSALYFRGPVLSRFDGREWLPPATRPGVREVPADLNVLGPPVNYAVTLEPSNRPWLFVIDATAQAPRLQGFEVRQTQQLQWLTNRPLTDIVRYSASSHPDFRYGPTRASGATLIALRDDVALPAGFNPRTIALAAELRRDPALATAAAPALVQAVLQRLRTGGYRYTLDPGVSGQHSADEFWFDRREGFCEHIASAFVILMRALDVPARVVTGYQGGEVNSVDGFWTVRQSDAHAWAEVWQDGAGWVRVDPTAAVAPARIGSLQRLQAPQGLVATALVAISPDLLARLRQGWEALNNGWNQWVLNYTQSKQLDLLKNLGFESPSWEDLARLLMGILVLASLCAAAWTLWERAQHDPWLRLLSRARRKLAAAGVSVPPQAPPRELARLAVQHLGPGPRTQALQQWLLQLEQLRYAPAVSTAATRQRLATLRREFNHLAWLDP
jgi:transglutaminase-like putative cysteine protease